MLDESRLDRIADDVGDRAEEVGSALDLPDSWPLPEEVIRAAMPAIRASRMPSVELLETGGKLLLRGVKDDVVMVWHQAPGVDRPVEPRSHSVKLAAEGIAVLPIPDDPPSIAAAAEDVVRLGSVDCA